MTTVFIIIGLAALVLTTCVVAYLSHVAALHRDDEHD
jgi:hypothetical protein